MSLFGNKATICLLLDQVVSNGILSVVDDTVDVDFVGHYPDRSDPVNGIEGYKQYMKEKRHAFPDLHVKIEDGWLTGEEDAHAVGRGNIVERVVVLLSVSATHRDDERGTASTGSRATWNEVHLIRCKEGKVVADRVISDQARL
jgi:predicted ester cyclase